MSNQKWYFVVPYKGMWGVEKTDTGNIVKCCRTQAAAQQYVDKFNVQITTLKKNGKIKSNKSSKR